MSVKGGGVSVPMVRDLKGVLDREKAPIGVFLTLEPPTRPMEKEAASAGVGALGRSRDSRMLFLLWFEHPDAIQAQRGSPSPHPEDVVQGAELAGL